MPSEINWKNTWNGVIFIGKSKKEKILTKNAAMLRLRVRCHEMNWYSEETEAATRIRIQLHLLLLLLLFANYDSCSASSNNYWFNQPTIHTTLPLCLYKLIVGKFVTETWRWIFNRNSWAMAVDFIYLQIRLRFRQKLRLQRGFVLARSTDFLFRFGHALIYSYIKGLFSFFFF